jgi:hypothetical protein
MENSFLRVRLDAATGALVGWLYLAGQAEVLGDFSLGAIIMPCAGR